MTDTNTDAKLTIQVVSARGITNLTVVQPADYKKRCEFGVRPPGTRDPRTGVDISIVRADVRFTTADNTGDGWPRWHVKIYRCDTRADAEELSLHLQRQAEDIQVANRVLPTSVDFVEPPWTVVPVHIVSGGRDLDLVNGPVSTRLGVVTAFAFLPDKVAPPAWYAADNDDAHRNVLAVSPFVQPAPFPAHAERWPALEYLPMFRSLALGLDMLHRAGVIHSDIKPDNVLTVFDEETGTNFVLIDTDAVAQTDPPPAPGELRGTEPYMYSPFRDGDRSRSVMIGHDRFGFAAVVLCALAGQEWVVHHLLRAKVPRTHRRVIDDPRAIAAELRQLWPDTGRDGWQPLIDEIVAAFADQAVESATWSAAAWLDRLIRVHTGVTDGEGTGRLTLSRPRQHAEQLAWIWRQANTSRRPMVPEEKKQTACAAAERSAVALAARAARWAMLRWFAMFAICAGVIAIGIGWRK